ncbi:DNA-binding winged helix-turn-helix (wHTH) domain-containing protein [Kaistia soli DSM 19436]|uniref:DNA-binding winged helix-turn-helix (WHTH) domain-containing protein n=1 Tax=Kaistia soli DSM 19436 TaxID=1122133 RepID=A0A1M5L709_9HYPH|nr:DNA-binding winged helix-turn-helix (wHTH) domain-containing protein [Kaistia soli DSM 19436]
MTVEPSMRTFGKQTRAALVPDRSWASGQATPTVPASLEFGPFSLRASERLLTRNGVPVSIGGRAFDLLLALVDRAGQVVGARQLHNLVWPDVVVEEANLRVCIATLRRTLGEQNGEARYIVNVAGRGYAFVAPVNRIAPTEAQTHPGAGSFCAASTLGQPPQLLISPNETIDVLSRLLASDTFARLTETSNVVPTAVARALLALLHEACGLDAACFILISQRQARLDGGRETSALAEHPPHQPTGNATIGAHPADMRLLIVPGRCQLVTMNMTPLFDNLLPVASVHFLATSREAKRAGLAGMSRLLHPADCGADSAAMIDALNQVGITAMSFQQWRAELGRPTGHASLRIEELQKENERLRQAISDLTLEKVILREASIGNL